MLETRRAVDDAAVRVLEGVKFGTVARGVSAEAGYLALVAEAMAEKSRLVPISFLIPYLSADLHLSIEDTLARSGIHTFLCSLSDILMNS